MDMRGDVPIAEPMEFMDAVEFDEHAKETEIHDGAEAKTQKSMTAPRHNKNINL